MTRETLDETIDRVAGELTAVAGNPALAGHLRERMHERRRPWLLPALAAACLAGAVVVATMLWPGDDGMAPAGGQLAATAVVPLAPLRTAIPPAVGDGTVLSRSQVGAAPVDRSRTSLASNAEPAGVPLPSADAARAADVGFEGPSPLAIAELAISQVTRPDPVVTRPDPVVIAELNVVPVVRPDVMAIAPIDVAPLDVPELPMINESKEQK